MTTNTLRWFMSIREMPHSSGFSYPVFEWSFGQENGIRGGELRAWITNGKLVFEQRRKEADGPNEWSFDSTEEALAKIAEYGWGEPPHITEVFQILTEAKAKLPVKNAEEAKALFEELRQKWQALLVS